MMNVFNILSADPPDGMKSLSKSCGYNPIFNVIQSPGTCFIKAAKAGVVDNLQGSVDALAWGRIPALGTGEIFDVVYSGNVSQDRQDFYFVKLVKMCFQLCQWDDIILTTMSELNWVSYFLNGSSS